MHCMKKSIGLYLSVLRAVESFNVCISKETYVMIAFSSGSSQRKSGEIKRKISIMIVAINEKSVGDNSITHQAAQPLYQQTTLREQFSNVHAVNAEFDHQKKRNEMVLASTN